MGEAMDRLRAKAAFSAQAAKDSEIALARIDVEGYVRKDPRTGRLVHVKPYVRKGLLSALRGQMRRFADTDQTLSRQKLPADPGRYKVRSEAAPSPQWHKSIHTMAGTVARLGPLAEYFGPEWFTPTSYDAYERGDVRVIVEKRFRPGGGYEPMVHPDKIGRFLDDVAAVTDAAKARNLPTSKFEVFVPAGDPTFAKGDILAYVTTGIPIINVHPDLANGKKMEPPSMPRQVKAELMLNGFKAPHFFMPVYAKIPHRQYTLTHEFGHLYGHQHGHGWGAYDNGDGTLSADIKPKDHAYLRRWDREHQTSYYATTDPMESYAEWFTQWFYDPESVPAAIVKKFGWGSGEPPDYRNIPNPLPED